MGTCDSLVSLRQLERRRSMVWSRQTRGASGHDTEKKDTKPNLKHAMGSGGRGRFEERAGVGEGLEARL
jgi:hypothetical protein